MEDSAIDGGHPYEHLGARRVLLNLTERCVREIGPAFAESAWDSVAVQDAAGRVSSGRVAVSDHDHLAEIPDLAARPLLHELSDRPVE